jgi:hypothetical protein
MVLLCAVFFFPAIIHAQVPTGRWEIVHTSGDSAAQTALYPGGFSTFLTSGGTGSTYATFANSICVVDDEGYNVVPTWTSPGGNSYTITITINNLGDAPDSAFIYTGTWAMTPIPGDTSVQIPTITGTYITTGDATACSDATMSSPGNFVATFLPDISFGSATGSLDDTDTDGGTPFDAPVNATVVFTTPTTPGGISGTISFATNPTFHSAACFAAPGGVVNPLTINATTSSQSGIIEQIYAQGFDPNGNPTTFVLDGYSANLYDVGAGTNTDPTANQITNTEWAAGAAIGEDNPDVLPDGVENDGTNNIMVLFYGVMGGVCDGAGGADSPFHLLQGRPVRHGHRRFPRRFQRQAPIRDRRQDRRR